MPHFEPSPLVMTQVRRSMSDMNLILRQSAATDHSSSAINTITALNNSYSNSSSNSVGISGVPMSERRSASINSFGGATTLDLLIGSSRHSSSNSSQHSSPQSSKQQQLQQQQQIPHILHRVSSDHHINQQQYHQQPHPLAHLTSQQPASQQQQQRYRPPHMRYEAPSTAAHRTPQFNPSIKRSSSSVQIELLPHSPPPAATSSAAFAGSPQMSMHRSSMTTPIKANFSSNSNLLLSVSDHPQPQRSAYSIINNITASLPVSPAVAVHRSASISARASSPLTLSRQNSSDSLFGSHYSNSNNNNINNLIPAASYMRRARSSSITQRPAENVIVLADSSTSPISSETSAVAAAATASLTAAATLSTASSIDMLPTASAAATALLAASEFELVKSLSEDSTCATFLVRNKQTGELSVFKPAEGEAYEQQVTVMQQRQKTYNNNNSSNCGRGDDQLNKPDQQLIHRSASQELMLHPASPCHSESNRDNGSDLHNKNDNNNNNNNSSSNSNSNNNQSHKPAFDERVAIKKGVSYGDTAIKEAAAFLMDHQHFAAVPVTVTGDVWIDSSSSSKSGSIIRGTEHLLMSGDQEQQSNQAAAAAATAAATATNDNSSNSSSATRSTADMVTAYGSLQHFEQHSLGSVEDFGSRLFSVADVHRLGILDIRLLNLDRHEGNVLVVRRDEYDAHNKTASTAAAAAAADDGSEQYQQHIRSDYKLIPIDHGYILPSYRDLSDVQFCWRHWKQTEVVFDAQELLYISQLNVLQDAMQLHAIGIRDEALVAFVFSSMLLQRAAAAGLNLSEIAAMIQRPDETYDSSNSSTSSSCSQQNSLTGNSSNIQRSTLERIVARVLTLMYHYDDDTDSISSNNNSNGNDQRSNASDDDSDDISDDDFIDGNLDLGLLHHNISNRHHSYNNNHNNSSSSNTSNHTTGLLGEHGPTISVMTTPQMGALHSGLLSHNKLKATAAATTATAATTGADAESISIDDVEDEIFSLHDDMPFTLDDNAHSMDESGHSSQYQQQQQQYVASFRNSSSSSNLFDAFDLSAEADGAAAATDFITSPMHQRSNTSSAPITIAARPRSHRGSNDTSINSSHYSSNNNNHDIDRNNHNHSSNNSNSNNNKPIVTVMLSPDLSNDLLNGRHESTSKSSSSAYGADSSYSSSSLRSTSSSMCSPAQHSPPIINIEQNSNTTRININSSSYKKQHRHADGYSHSHNSNSSGAGGLSLFASSNSPNFTSAIKSGSLPTEHNGFARDDSTNRENNSNNSNNNDAHEEHPHRHHSHHQHNHPRTATSGMMLSAELLHNEDHMQRLLTATVMCIDDEIVESKRYKAQQQEQQHQQQQQQEQQLPSGRTFRRGDSINGTSLFTSTAAAAAPIVTAVTTPVIAVIATPIVTAPSPSSTAASLIKLGLSPLALAAAVTATTPATNTPLRSPLLPPSMNLNSPSAIHSILHHTHAHNQHSVKLTALSLAASSASPQNSPVNAAVTAAAATAAASTNATSKYIPPAMRSHHNNHNGNNSHSNNHANNNSHRNR